MSSSPISTNCEKQFYVDVSPHNSTVMPMLMLMLMNDMNDRDEFFIEVWADFVGMLRFVFKRFIAKTDLFCFIGFVDLYSLSVDCGIGL